MSMFHSCYLLFDHFQHTLTHEPNILGFYIILFFIALDFTSITSHILNWMLFFLWLSLFIFSGVISPLISRIILGTYWPRDFIFQYPIFLSFHTLHRVLKEIILQCFSIPFSSGPCFFRTLHHDLSILVTLQSMSHSFIELDKAEVLPCYQFD